MKLISTVHFYCPVCGNMKIDKKDFEDNRCPCGREIRRYTIRVNDKGELEKAKTGVDLLEKYSPRLSYSMAISPRQLPEAMKLWPDSEYVPDKRGDMLLLKVNSRQDKLRKMSERGLIELE